MILEALEADDSLEPERALIDRKNELAPFRLHASSHNQFKEESGETRTEYDEEYAGVFEGRSNQFPFKQVGDYFFSSDGETCRIKHNDSGEVIAVLANFTATIVEQIDYHDGVERRLTLLLEGRLANGQAQPQVELDYDEFCKMHWPVLKWGAQAVVHAGTASHLRAAIQLLSGKPPRRTVFQHSGWTYFANDWYYLHGDGAIGSAGNIASQSVLLPEGLGGYRLPMPPAGDALRSAVLASLSLINLAPGEISFPVLAAIYRASLGATDFALHLVGPTGIFKSELAAIAQQHFGAELDARHLPGGWSSTANALEASSFAVKDAIFVVDDFAPTGSAADIQRLHREADRLIRAAGNQSGRQRMRPDTRIRPAKPPRSLILSTGEVVPRGPSLRARLLVVEIAHHQVDREKLTKCQGLAREGVYASAMAGFVQWLAPQYDRVTKEHRGRVTVLRDEAQNRVLHARTPGLIAELALGLEMFLKFAVDVGAIADEVAQAVWTRGWECLCQAAENQVQHQEAADPVLRFIRLVADGLAFGQSHVSAKNGKPPSEAPESWGWHNNRMSDGDSTEELWHPAGRHIGWLVGKDLYLDPKASHVAAVALAEEQGERFELTRKTLHKRLRENGYLESRDEVRGTNTCRRMIDGARRDVLHMRAVDFLPRT